MFACLDAFRVGCAYGFLGLLWQYMPHLWLVESINTHIQMQASWYMQYMNTHVHHEICSCLQMIHRLGKEIDHPDSIYYWAYKNNVPVYCPALTDGSLGDMLYFHTFKNPGLILDIVADIRAMNDEAMKAPPRKTGVIILGGGKHLRPA